MRWSARAVRPIHVGRAVSAVVRGYKIQGLTLSFSQIRLKGRSARFLRLRSRYFRPVSVAYVLHYLSLVYSGIFTAIGTLYKRNIYFTPLLTHKPLPPPKDLFGVRPWIPPFADASRHAYKVFSPILHL